MNGRDNAGWQPLHDASFHGHTAIVELLMQLGAGVNERGGEERSTPLMEAISGGSIDTAFALLAIGADPLVRDRSVCIELRISTHRPMLYSVQYNLFNVYTLHFLW